MTNVTGWQRRSAQAAKSGIVEIDKEREKSTCSRLYAKGCISTSSAGHMTGVEDENILLLGQWLRRESSSCLSFFEKIVLGMGRQPSICAQRVIFELVIATDYGDLFIPAALQALLLTIASKTLTQSWQEASEGEKVFRSNSNVRPTVTGPYKAPLNDAGTNNGPSL
jgi:hypothetical protein